MTEQSRKIRPYRRLQVLLLVLALLVLGFKLCTRMPAPADQALYEHSYERVEEGPDRYSCEDSWLRKNEFGLWEMYLEGDPFELGMKNGVLAREQIHSQEVIFVEGLREMVPGNFYIRFLKQLIIWMNRNMDRHVPLAYQQEIYGVALEASEEFNFIGPPYARILNYHAAHDIGHALQNMNLVACTAIALKDGRTVDGGLLVGRNFDFSMGDDFARDKILAFYRPDSGHAFASVTWGGLIGVVTGMNEEGLVVSLNAAKSGIPRSTRTPVSILARAILQHASNIEEAWEIAAAHDVFVSESFLISSARDRRSVVIEKSPDAMALYDPEGDSLILSNHFQSEHFLATERTQQNIAEGASMYRWERSLELIQEREKHDVASMLDILRNQDGKGGASIGMGNEKAVNQLVAHHAVIFQPEKKRMWVSTNPYQLGDFLCYDLDHIFGRRLQVKDSISPDSLRLPADPFLEDEAFAAFREYQRQSLQIKTWLDDPDEDLELPELDAYLKLNPDFYYPWYLVGEVYRERGQAHKARSAYLRSLEKEIPRMVDRRQVEEGLEALEKK